MYNFIDVGPLSIWGQIWWRICHQILWWIGESLFNFFIFITKFITKFVTKHLGLLYEYNIYATVQGVPKTLFKDFQLIEPRPDEKCNWFWAPPKEKTPDFEA